jgi:putative transposase
LSIGHQEKLGQVGMSAKWDDSCHRASPERLTRKSRCCLEAVEKALSKYGKPEIFNTAQESQFTSEAFTERLRRNEI